MTEAPFMMLFMLSLYYFATCYSNICYITYSIVYNTETSKASTGSLSLCYYHIQFGWDIVVDILEYGDDGSIFLL